MRRPDDAGGGETGGGEGGGGLGGGGLGGGDGGLPGGGGGEGGGGLRSAAPSAVTAYSYPAVSTPIAFAIERTAGGLRP